ncbi:MAG: hypothetical protein ACP5OF_07190 [bacterium]
MIKKILTMLAAPEVVPALTAVTIFLEIVKVTKELLAEFDEEED